MYDRLQVDVGIYPPPVLWLECVKAIERDGDYIQIAIAYDIRQAFAESMVTTQHPLA